MKSEKATRPDYIPPEACKVKVSCKVKYDTTELEKGVCNKDLTSHCV